MNTTHTGILTTTLAILAMSCGPGAEAEDGGQDSGAAEQDAGATDAGSGGGGGGPGPVDSGSGGGGDDDAGSGGGDEDAGSDGGEDAGSGGSDAMTRSAHCDSISDAIVADATGEVIEVSPGPAGQVLVGGQMRTLRDVVRGAKEGDTVLLADGTYTLGEAPDGGYTGIYMTTPGVTIRGASGDASKVVIDSEYSSHGSGSAPITIDAPRVTIAHLSVERSIYHLVHLWKDADDVTIHDVVMRDGGQQFLKSSTGSGLIEDVRVTCSTFDMTDEGRDNVWGYGSTSGNTTCYTGGIDSHEGAGWVVSDNVFRGIYCDATGVERPAHGRFPGQRGGQTYQGGLAEFAIHFWDSPENTGGHRIERNLIIDCARGIGLGFTADVYDSVVQNNMVASRFAGSREHDVGIYLDRAHATTVAHNTVVMSHPDGYSSAIEYRRPGTANPIVNNLTNRRIRERDGGVAELAGNVTGAELSWFEDAQGGGLHLSACDLGEVAGAGERPRGLALPAEDFDMQERSGALDVGADQCSE